MASRATGGCFLVLLGIGAASVFIAAAPAAGMLTLWSALAVWLWWAVSRPLPEPEETEEASLSPAPARRRVIVEEPQVGAVEVTRVGDARTVISHPSERRVYRVEESRASDPPGA